MGKTTERTPIVLENHRGRRGGTEQMLLQGKRISRRTLNEVSHLRKNRVQATSSSATAASRLFTVHRTFPKESKRSPRN